MRRARRGETGGTTAFDQVGMHSPWTSRVLKKLGHRVLVANPRKVRAISIGMTPLCIVAFPS